MKESNFHEMNTHKSLSFIQSFVLNNTRKHAGHSYTFVGPNIVVIIMIMNEKQALQSVFRSHQRSARLFDVLQNTEMRLYL